MRIRRFFRRTHTERQEGTVMGVTGQTTADTRFDLPTSRYIPPYPDCHSCVAVKTPPIPNEIQDRILDFLHDSKPALKACALTCQAWIPTSRYHLFSKIRINAWNADSITATFSNLNCTIRSCTHLELWADYATDVAMRLTKVLRLLSTHLKPSSLLLGEWPIFDQQTIATLALFPSTERLSLEMHHVAVEDLRYLDTVFVNFPNIRELRMEHCAFENAPYTPDNQVFTPRLRSLEFINCAVMPLLLYFLRRQIVPTNLFSLNCFKPGGIPAVGEYFSRFGDLLQEIQLGFHGVSLSTGNFTLYSAF